MYKREHKTLRVQTTVKREKKLVIKRDFERMAHCSQVNGNKG